MAVKKLRIDVVSLVKTLEIVLKLLVNTQITSRYRSVYKGKGLEFEDYRVYMPDDDASRIDWKASIKANELLIKLFKEERNLNVYIILDTSSHMIFGSTEKLKLEYAAELAASLAYFILEANDKVGLIMANDKIVKMIPPASGKKQFYIILNALTNPEFYGGGKNLSKAIDFIMKISKEKGLIIIISDFIDFKEEWEKSLKLAKHKFDIICAMIRDPRDEYMPEEDVGQFVLQDPLSNNTILIDPKKIIESYKNYVSVEESKIKEILTKNNIDFVKFSTAESFMKNLIELFIRRRKLAWR
ncbi:MAG: DUF58 domain-containing protein [Candidatus Aenigmatarchaeota archaeon]